MTMNSAGSQDGFKAHSSPSSITPGCTCFGRYDFPGTASHDLPFKKGDSLFIISDSKDPNWYKARRSDGLEGMIPFNYVTLKPVGPPRQPPPYNARAVPSQHHQQQLQQQQQQQRQRPYHQQQPQQQQQPQPQQQQQQQQHKHYQHQQQQQQHQASRSTESNALTLPNFPAPPPPTSAPSHKGSRPRTTSRDESAVITDRKRVHLQMMPWFHGDITREEAEKRLTKPPKDGNFLVRESQAFRGNYTLCVVFEGKVENYKVTKREDGKVSVDGEEYFKNLIILVEHYQKDADGLCCPLMHQVETPGKQEFVVDKEEFQAKGWAIPRDKLKIEHKLGQGEYGEVWRGEYKGKKIAIKSMKEIKSGQAVQQFLAEASIMTTLRHQNLVALIGVSLDGSPIYLVTEFMAKGSLVEYLRTRGRSVISKSDLLKFAKHVCKGMVYLESRNFIHRDLAARNVLVSEDEIAKVSDFGLAREGLSRTDSQKLPVKWTAPEALKDHKFSNKSDVWSFGILLWELYSYGRVPYPRVAVDNISQYVEKGYRMDAPDGCPDAVYGVMKECWESNPAKRPTFTRIMKTLDSLPSS